MHQDFREYYEKHSIVHENHIKSKSKEVLCVTWGYELSFIDEIDNPELIKLLNLENTECLNNGDIIWLVPHKEYSFRKKKVLIKDELRELNLQPHFNYSDNTRNKGFKISFESADSETYIDYIDPNAVLYNGVADDPLEGILELAA